MLPLKLELKNFLAYCNPDALFFEGIHLACLSGPNGAGKSSILDAITWVIWGKARASSDDELIHIGCDEMAVTLDFVQGNNRYRIIRQRKLGSQRKKDGARSPGTTLLDLFGWVEDERRFRVISEPSIRQTQQKINDLVGLDYETFVNSAYLQQGKADSFTVQAPAHRKKILGEILNLDLWDVYEERTKERLRSIGNELAVIDSNLRDIERETAEEGMIRQEYELAETQLEIARDQAAKAEALFREMMGADAELSAAETELRQTRYLITDRQREITAAEDQMKRHRERLATYQEVINQRESIEQGYAMLVEAQEADQALGDALRELRDIDQLIFDLTQQISLAQQKIEHEITSSETLIDEATRQGDVIEQLQGEIEAVREKIVELERDENRRNTLQQDIATLKQEQASLKASNETLRPEMDSLRQRLDMIERATDPSCPLCGQPLTEDHRQELVAQLQQEGTQRGDKFRANKSRGDEIRLEVEEREQSVRILTQSLPALAPLRGQLGSLEQQLYDAENARRRGQELHAHVDLLRSTLHARDFAHELQLQLQETEQRRASLGYDAEAHDEVRKTLKSYKTYQDQATQLEIALQSIPDVEQALAEAEERAERWQEALVNLTARAGEIETNLVELNARVTEMRRRESEWQYQRTLERQAMEKRISLRQRLTAIEDMQRRRRDLEQRQASLLEQQGVYNQLKNAFSKNGIPAMVIEAAIPELEETTNHLLMRMTDGRLTVRFDTQREKKTGGVIETFDILIADELGTRDYSLYSGGEVFRINFAIRVAISQLLARRAGAKLRTLFIDEGFGTQDDAGRERLVEAITAIQDDFDLILVITHIDELRDAFPVRIEIEKMADGSRIRMM